MPIRHEYGRKADPSLGLRMARVDFSDCDKVYAVKFLDAGFHRHDDKKTNDLLNEFCVRSLAVEL